jgi:hypothetical protein
MRLQTFHKLMADLAAEKALRDRHKPGDILEIKTPHPYPIYAVVEGYETKSGRFDKLLVRRVFKNGTFRRWTTRITLDDVIQNLGTSPNQPPPFAWLDEQKDTWKSESFPGIPVSGTTS